MQVGGRKVVLSDSIVTNGPVEDVKFEYEDLSFQIKFEPSSKEKSASIAYEVGNKKMVLVATGFNNTLGSAWSSDVGHLNGKKLHLALFAHLIGDADTGLRVVTLTLSVETI